MSNTTYAADADLDLGQAGVEQQVRSAVQLLEAVAKDRALLAEVSEEQRNRLLQAAGQVARPDARDRKRLLKASLRKRKAERVQREEALLSQTGIRELRRKPVFTTPNVYPPRELEQEDLGTGLGTAGTVEPRHC